MYWIRHIGAAVILALVLAIGVEGQGERGPGSNGPEKLTVGVLVDNSGSFRTILDRVITSTKTVINDLRPEEEGFLFTFVSTEKVVLRQELTANKQDLQDAADNMFVEGGMTSVLDAVKIATKYFVEQSRPDDRSARVLVVITDGDERASATSIEDVVKALKAANVRVFVLGLYDEKFYTKIVDRLCKETGGAKFVPKFPKDTNASIAALLTAMRSK